MATDITQLVFPTVSDNCRQVIELLSSNEPDFKKLEIVLSRSDTLSRAVIKYSNSPFHHRDNEISDVVTAINILGLANIYNAVMATILKDYVRDNVTGSRILQHCVTISALASFIASKTRRHIQHEIELLGILHDLPSLVLCRNFKPEYREMAKSLSAVTPTLDVLEQEKFAVARCDLLNPALQDLALPPKFGEMLGRYHAIVEPEQAEEDDYMIILSMAHHMELNVIPQNHRLPDTVPGDKKSLLEKLAISEDDYAILINECQDFINEHIALVV